MTYNVLYGVKGILEGIPVTERNTRLEELFDTSYNGASPSENRRKLMEVYYRGVNKKLNKYEKTSHKATSEGGTYLDQQERIKAAWELHKYTQRRPSNRPVPKPFIETPDGNTYLLSSVTIDQVYLNGVPDVVVNYSYRLTNGETDDKIKGTDLYKKLDLLLDCFERCTTYTYLRLLVDMEWFKVIDRRPKYEQANSLATYEQIFVGGVYYPSSENEYRQGRWVTDDEETDDE